MPKYIINPKTKRKQINIEIGQKFGKLTVLKFYHKDRHGYYYLCQCACGNKTVVCNFNLITHTKSCGCLKNLKGKDAYDFKHGLVGTNFYGVWNAMKTRCLNKKFKYYNYYGGRGIKICSQWLNFIGFKEDKKHTIPKI